MMLENRCKTIRWNVLEPSPTLNTFNLASFLRSKSSLLSISFKAYVGFVLSLYFCSRKSIMQVAFWKQSPVAIALCRVLLGRPATWSASPLLCSGMLTTRMIGTAYLFYTKLYQTYLYTKFPPELHLQNFFLITFIEFFKFVSTHGLNAKVRYVTHKVAH